MNKILNFNLTNQETISFESKYTLETLLCCDEIYVYFNADEVFLLNIDCSHELITLKDMLISALRNQLLLHNSITKDIGYLSNQEYHGDPNLELIFNAKEGQEFWVGRRYNLWETPGDVTPSLATWLYNNEKGEIILEITPNYPWHFSDPTPEENFIPYEQWIKDYKPFIIRTIPQEVAKRWLAQVEHLIEVFEKKEKNHIQN